MIDLVKTIKSDGTGDYTTMYAFNIVAQFQSTDELRWVAECYKVGNLGGWSPASWNNPAMGSRAFPAPGSEVTGPFVPADTDTVAYFEGGTDTANTAASVSIPNVTIEGILLNAKGGRSIVSVRSTFCVIKNCVLIHTGFGDAGYGLGIWGRVTVDRPELFNCYIDITGATAMRGGLSDRSRAGEGFKSIVNCVVISGPGQYAIDLTKGSGVIKNTYANTWRGSFVTADHNASPDTAAIGTNPVHNVVEDDAFVDLANQNARIVSEEALHNAGVDASEYLQAQTDFIGTPRPQSGAWDIGPLELKNEGGATTRSLRQHQRKMFMFGFTDDDIDVI